MKKALIVTAFARFIKSFLTNDILTLQKMGYEVHCAANIHHAAADCMPEYFREMKVQFHQIEFSSNRPVSEETLKSYCQMRKLLSEIRYDVIHCHTPIAGAITRITSKKQRRQGCKVIYTTHGFYFHKFSNWKTWAIYYTVENLMSYLSDAIITINREDYKNAQHMHSKRVYYIPGVGVDTNLFINTKIDRNAYREKIGVERDDFLILAVGELSRRKNHQIIIKALGEAKIPRAVFMICGNAMTNANTKDELELLAKEYSVDLRLMGLRDDIPEICKCADIGVMPSTREGLGLSGIEMLAAGLPVVASDVHGIIDYISDGENGYLCNPNDAHAFSEAIRRLYSETKRKNMKSACINTSKKFDKKISIEEMKKIYKDILS